jgi:hypothetical protein
MVNAGFPAQPSLWFRNRSRAEQVFRACAPHQSKIYAESNRSDFLRIFGGLSSMQTLAIYGRLLSQEPIA